MYSLPSNPERRKGWEPSACRRTVGKRQRRRSTFLGEKVPLFCLFLQSKCRYFPRSVRVAGRGLIEVVRERPLHILQTTAPVKYGSFSKDLRFVSQFEVAGIDTDFGDKARLTCFCGHEEAWSSVV